MTSEGKIILGAVTIVFLILTLVIGAISLFKSKRKIDKIRYSFLLIGSLFSLIFVLNV